MGNTLKTMETKSGAKIAIRGKGSVKEGKGRSDAAHTSNQEEDLHCLIMADTEEKVNKAKELIHQVIETVRGGHLFLLRTMLISCRLLPFPKVKTSSSATNFVSLPPSTALFVMTRIKLARTVVRLVTASTIAPTRRTSLPTSSVVSVATLVIWLETVLTVLADKTGAITTVVDLVVLVAAVLLVASKLALAMPSTRSTLA